MTYVPKFDTFYFERYEYDKSSRTARFEYSFDKTERFTETVRFGEHSDYDEAVFARVMELAFVVAGVSYYKAQPTKSLVYETGTLSPAQAKFFSRVYRDGLSQFVYENGINPSDIGEFLSDETAIDSPLPYKGSGTDVLQSGGKDSLLLATLLKKNSHDFETLFMQQGGEHPAVIDKLGVRLRKFERMIDRTALERLAQQGYLNGHVPVTFITLCYGLLDCVLQNRDTLLAAIGWEGEEPHDYIGEYSVTHQWSKTWGAEQALAGYIHDVITADLHVGSPLRGYSELKVAELFVMYCWNDFGHDFSSCNVANYRQGHSNGTLTWCGRCPKCANSFLLFASFLPQEELIGLFGRDLYQADDLVDTFKGLLGVDDVVKPFECVGEIDELRMAYELSQQNGHSSLPFLVPLSNFDRNATHMSQAWASRMVQ